MGALVAWVLGCSDTEPIEKAEPAAPAASEPAERPGGIPIPPPPLFPRGLVVNEPGATPGYVLFNPLVSDTTYLVDNQGFVVHTWKTPYSPGGGMYVLPNGNLLRPGRDPSMSGFRAGGTGGILQELDWDGKLVWEWRLSGETAVQHHDVEPLPNGNVLVLAWEVKSAEEARRAGRRSDQIPAQGLWPDWVLEVKPRRTPPWGGEVVWEWHVWDHLVQDHEAEADGYGDPRDHPDRLDVNAGTVEISADELSQLQALGYVDPEATPEDLRSDFLHTNAIDYNARLDQIALSVPTLAEVWIIDHGISTQEASGPKGGLLYRWGNPAVYRRGPEDNVRLFYQHDVRWIPDGWQGAGNLTVFNNGRERPEGPFSSIDEWTASARPGRPLRDRRRGALRSLESRVAVHGRGADRLLFALHLGCPSTRERQYDDLLGNGRTAARGDAGGRDRVGVPQSLQRRGQERRRLAAAARARELAVRGLPRDASVRRSCGPGWSGSAASRSATGVVRERAQRVERLSQPQDLAQVGVILSDVVGLGKVARVVVRRADAHRAHAQLAGPGDVGPQQVAHVGCFASVGAECPERVLEDSRVGFRSAYLVREGERCELLEQTAALEQRADDAARGEPGVTDEGRPEPRASQCGECLEAPRERVHATVEYGLGESSSELGHELVDLWRRDRERFEAPTGHVLGAGVRCGVPGFELTPAGSLEGRGSARLAQVRTHGPRQVVQAANPDRL